MGERRTGSDNMKVIFCKDCEYISGKVGDHYCYLDGRCITGEGEEDFCSWAKEVKI